MKKNYSSLFSIAFILIVLYGIYFSMMPQWIANEESLSEFSTQRVLGHIKIISEKPHFVGSENHAVVARYLQAELQNLGLKTQIQEGTTLSGWGNLVKSKNIIARIPGSDNSKALLLLSHYDSAPHSFSHGASDDASGVATILEGLRAFLHNKTPHKNDIIVLFSDAEELGLNGAALFVMQNQWAKNIGLALNFEARGSSGPSYMLMEANEGNAAMVDGFTKAQPQYPVSNSLMYSIYKMLPNDTDLTVFREQGKVPGFNFAFIDGHYNYHSAQDDYAHVNPETIAHQGTYLMPLLQYFSNADLENMDSTEDFVYFNIPFQFINYPFSWILPMCIGALALFLFLVFIGIGKRLLNGKEIVKGFLPLFGSLLVSGIITFFGWKILCSLNPQYQDMLNGFTYNGHSYIVAFVLLSLAISLLFYVPLKTESSTANYTIAPLFLWIGINFSLAFYLPGAGFFIIPVFSCLLMLAYFVITQKTNLFVNLLLAIPALVIFAPFIAMFPIGLGLKILTGSAVLTVLVFTLLLPVFGMFSRKGIWATVFLIASTGFFISAQLHSGYEAGKAKPNSLLYVLDANSYKAYWATYDLNLDEWTKNYLGENPQSATSLNTIPLFSKYGTPFSFSANAPLKNIAGPTIEFLRDSTAGTQRYLKIRISPNRNVNRYDIFAHEKMAFHNLKANNATALGQKGSLYLRKDKRIVSYYVVGNEPLVLQFSIPKQAVFDMEVIESSFDLMSNPLFAIAKRKDWMMPMPFVLNDAIVIRQKLKPTLKIPEEKTLAAFPKRKIKTDSLTGGMASDTLKAPQ